MTTPLCSSQQDLAAMKQLLTAGSDDNQYRQDTTRYLYTACRFFLIFPI
jgi:hypothetical protein